MKPRLFVAAAVASTTVLALALVPANAAPTTITDTETFSSVGEVEDAAPAEVTPVPEASPSAADDEVLPEPNDVKRIYVRGYQTLYSKTGLSYVLGDVDVTGGVEYCRILSDVTVNGKVRAEPATMVAGAYAPSDDDASGRVGIIAKYGAAAYRFGPSDFIGAGIDGECDTADDVVIGSDETLSNTVRIRYSTKGTVKYARTGKTVKINVVGQRFDRTATFVPLGSVQLQYRKPGTTSWKLKKTLPLDASGRAAYSFSSAATSYYRIYVPLTDNVQSTYSGTTRI